MKQIKIISMAGFLVCYILFLFLAYGFSAGFFVDVQTSVLSKAMEVSGLHTSTMIEGIGRAFLSILMLGLSIVFLSSYGIKNSEDRNTPLLAALVAGVLTLLVFNFTIVSFLLFLFCLAAGWFAPALGDMYYKELTRWKMFRTGAKTAGKMLLIFNILLAVGVFASVSTGDYQEKFQNSFTDMITTSVADFDKMIEDVPESEKAAVLEQLKIEAKDSIENSMTNSPLFQTYMNWLPLIAAISAWVSVEILRALIVSNIAGLFSSVWLRIQEKI